MMGIACDINSNHKLWNARLHRDPLGHQTVGEGGELRLLRLCNSCYIKRRAQLDVINNRVCDVDPNHKLGKLPLRSDPLRGQINAAGGGLRIRQLCNSCYRKALAERDVINKRVCDVDPNHKLGITQLRSDPLGGQITAAGGELRVRQLCQSCYKKARAEMDIINNRVCDVDPNHKLGITQLRSDPLGGQITAAGGELRVRWLCQSCYNKRLAERDVREGKACDMDPKHRLGNYPLHPDPLGRQITAAGGELKVRQLCYRCYHKERYQVKKNIAQHANPENKKRKRETEVPPHRGYHKERYQVKKNIAQHANPENKKRKRETEVPPHDGLSHSQDRDASCVEAACDAHSIFRISGLMYSHSSLLEDSVPFKNLVILS